MNFDKKVTNCSTVSGASKYFGCGEQYRLKFILNCDEHTLEFQFVKDKESFWKVKLPESNQNLLHYPFVSIYNVGTWAKFIN